LETKEQEGGAAKTGVESDEQGESDAKKKHGFLTKNPRRVSKLQPGEKTMWYCEDQPQVLNLRNVKKWVLGAE